MELVRHTTEAIYRRYAIALLEETAAKLDQLRNNARCSKIVGGRMKRLLFQLRQLLRFELSSRTSLLRWRMLGLRNADYIQNN